MISTEKVVQTKTCKHCHARFEITDKDIEFYEKISPILWWKKYSIPTPTLCPDCRQKRRLSFRNERKLYKRKCDATGKDIISMYNPESEYTIYDSKFWWSDKWDPKSYGIDLDFSKSFFTQYSELSKNIPRTSLILPGTNENSDYANDTADAKNCYMTVCAYIAEDCYYGYAVIFWTKHCVDCSWLIACEHCYECSYSNNLLFCNYCQVSTYLSNSQYCIDCHGCSYCFWCVWLKNSQYHIFNKPYLPEDYKKKIKTIHKEEIKQAVWKLPIQNIFNVWCENILDSDICKNSSYLSHCFNISNGENCKYWVYAGARIVDSYDFFMAGTPPMSKTLETIWVYRTFQSAFLFSCDESQNIYYCDTCYKWNSYLFWCLGLRNSSYCILNKQYSKEEYEILVPKIIEHMQKTWEWWEFFPSSLSPFWYNETVAQEYFSLSKEESLKQWYNWSDYETPFPKVSKIIKASMLPENIEDIPDDILNRAIECEITKKPFRIISQELEFYRKHNLPIPKRHPDQRHLDRMALINPKKLFERTCDIGVENYK